MFNLLYNLVKVANYRYSGKLLIQRAYFWNIVLIPRRQEENFWAMILN